MMNRLTFRTLIKRFKHQFKHVLGPTIKRYTPQRTNLSPSLWGLQHDAAGGLSLDGISLRELLDRYGSPLHVVDRRKLDQNVADFLAPPPGATRGCEVYYSYKTNPIPGVLQRMHHQGIGAEVISPYELWLALKLGVAPEKIVYNGPAKSDESLRLAIKQEIGLVNFNSREEIEPFAALAHEIGKRPRVGVRVVAPGGWNAQFGVSIEGGAALQAFAEAVARPELNVAALQAHLGYEIATVEQATYFVTQVLRFCDELHARLGLDLEIIDLGGSLACPTTRRLSPREVQLNTTFGCDLVPRSPDTVLSIPNYVKQVVELVERHYNQAGRTTPRIFLEPGRAMTANTQMLLCQVLNTKASDGDLSYAVLDAGINVAESVRNEYHQLFPVGPARTGRRQTYRLVGRICTPADVLYNAWELPELAPGDALAIMDAGAYFVPFATSFSFPQPAVVLVEDGRHRLLRRAETFDDLVMLDAMDAPKQSIDEELEAWIDLSASAPRPIHRLRTRYPHVGDRHRCRQR
jgi:diaminopimelate decarboxylase